MSMQSVVNLDLFGNVIQEKEKVVNVSSVPQRSPFRYPGGKTWLVPTSRKWFRHSSMCDTLIEPFCGGGITGLTAVSEGYLERWYSLKSMKVLLPFGRQCSMKIVAGLSVKS